MLRVRSISWGLFALLKELKGGLASDIFKGMSCALRFSRLVGTEKFPTHRVYSEVICELPFFYETMFSCSEEIWYYE